MHLRRSLYDLQMVQLRHIPKCVPMQSAESITPEIPENIKQIIFPFSKYLY